MVLELYSRLSCYARCSFPGPLMEMHQVRYFLTVARTLSFTQAAEKLGYAQSSVSAQIQALEREIGAPLFQFRLQPF